VAINYLLIIKLHILWRWFFRPSYMHFYESANQDFMLQAKNAIMTLEVILEMNWDQYFSLENYGAAYKPQTAICQST